jgi:hypothetical protein
LLKNAHVVKRYEELRFELYNLEKAVMYHKVVYTILDENGDDFAQTGSSYDKKFTDVPEISGRLTMQMAKK